MSRMFKMRGLVLGAALASTAGCTVAPTSTEPATAALITQNSTLRYDANDPATCSPGAACAGTETLALENVGDTLFAGLSNSSESDPGVYPTTTSAQVLRFDPTNNQWSPTPPLPGACGPQSVAWERVNDLQALDAGAGGLLLAATTPNRDDHALCPDLHGTVFVGDGTNNWTDTGLGARLDALYTSQGFIASVQHVTVNTTATGCSTAQPCLFAAVGLQCPPANEGTSACAPSIWQAADTDPGAGVTFDWTTLPPIVLDGIALPIATRITALHTASDGSVLVGSGVPRTFGTQSFPACSGAGTLACPRAALLRRSPAGAWTTMWRGPKPGAAGPFEFEVPGVTTLQSGAQSLVWFLTNPRGHVRRIGPTGTSQEDTLRDKFNCVDFIGHQLLRTPVINGRALLLVAAEGCTPSASTGGSGLAMAFVRDVVVNAPAANQKDWDNISLPQIQDDPATTLAREDALRTIHVSPFACNDLFLGATNMNGQAATRRARVFEASLPITCP